MIKKKSQHPKKSFFFFKVINFLIKFFKRGFSGVSLLERIYGVFDYFKGENFALTFWGGDLVGA